ncbi:MAG TPA: ShlB/FhaC/HecB family hemolysin secretion/activation protein [Novosphingobium sp.]|nr:ShlB/FhaC/HecB family hemolysin secretion/activation protein [Novosphingobium sp.]
MRATADYNRKAGRRYGPIRRGLLLGQTVLAAALPCTAQAQSAPPPAPTREELDQGRALDRLPSPRPRVEITGEIERGPCPLADPAFAQTRVTFSHVTFAHLEAVAPSVLDDTWRDMAGRDLPIAALCEVRDRAATALREMGYLAAVQIPPQRIEKGGDVRMDVLVARLVEVQVRGEAGANESAIAAHLARLTKEPWFNTRLAERQLLLLSDMPGYQVRLTLKPAKGAPGDVIGDVLVRREPFELVAGVQNLGSKATGREGLFVQAAINGVTGLADRTTLSLYNTFDFDEQTVLQAGHDFALGASGLRLGGNLLWGRSEPSGPLPFKSETLAAEIGLSYPLVRRRALSVRAAGGLEIVDQDIEFASTPLTRDHLRVLYARIALDAIAPGSLVGQGGYSVAEPRWRLGAQVEARRGLDALGASEDCTPITQCLTPNVPISNLLADPSGFVLRGEATAEFRPVQKVTLAVSPRAQYSPDTLLSYEQFSVGNYTVGRGLDPGTLLGDSGVGSSFELRYGSLARAMDKAIAVQPFAFLDAAWAWRRDDGADDPRTAYTAGGGLRARWGDKLDANLTLAVPLKRAGFQQQRGDVRVLFTIRARLWPWNPS